MGDTVTFAGIRNMQPNPGRRWWQVWKPRRVAAGLKRFTVVECGPLQTVRWDVFVGEPAK